MPDLVNLMLIRQMLEEGIEAVEEQLPGAMVHRIDPTPFTTALAKSMGREPTETLYYPCTAKLRSLLLTLDEGIAAMKKGCGDEKA